MPAPDLLLADDPILKVLTDARARIEVPEQWAVEGLAYNAEGDEVDPMDASAVCWCGYGAILRADHSNNWSFPTDTASILLDKAVGGSFPDWQDAPDRTHAEVLDAFDRAIAARRAELAGVS